MDQSTTNGVSPYQLYKHYNLTIHMIQNLRLSTFKTSKITLLKKITGIALSLILMACEQPQKPALNEKTKFNKQATKNTLTNSPYGLDATFNYPNFSGQYPVASIEMTLTDNSRIETLDEKNLTKLESQFGPRKFNIRFYYPSADVALDRIALDRVALDYKNSSARLPVISKTSWANLIGPQKINNKMLRYSNYANAFWDIKLNQKPSNKQADFPLLIFSHGYGFSPEAYTALSAELASQGFIVISINHTFGANPTALHQSVSNPTIENIQWAKELPREDIGRYLPTWSDDQIFVIEELIRLNGDFKSPFYNKLNLSQLGIFGHSYGGAASYLTAARDPRVKAIMDIDGTLFEAKEFDLYQPFAFIHSKNHQPEYKIDKLNSEAFLIKLEQFEHVSFTDHILWWQWDHGDLKLNQGEINSLQAVETTSQLVQSFFNHYLSGSEESWIQPLTSNSKKIEQLK